MSSTMLAQMCSGPPKKTNSVQAPPKPSAQMASKPTGKTSSYTTLHDWGPVVVRYSREDCTVDRLSQNYASEDHAPDLWNAVVANLPGRAEYAQYNTAVEEGNSVVGTNSREANFGASQYGCTLPLAKECHPVIITDEGTVAGSMKDAEVAVCLSGDEILNVGRSTSESDCAAKCSADRLCAAYTFTGNQCILQNGLMQTQNPGYLLGQHSAGLKTHVRHCNFVYKEDGEIVCEDEPQKEKNCFGPFPPDRFDITECHPNQREGQAHFFERMEPLTVMEWKSSTTVEPGVPPPANDTSVLPNFGEEKK